MTEDLPGGRQVERDPTTGQFKKTTLPSETAAAMGKKSRSHDLAVERLLAEEGYTKENPAPEYVAIMAAQAVRTPAAMNHWRKYHSRISPSEYELDNTRELQEGEKCPTCGQYFDVLNRLWDIVGENTE